MRGPTKRSNSVHITAQTQVDSPTIAITVDHSEVCQGAMLNFTATYTNGGNTPVLQWKKNYVTNVGQNTAMFSSPLNNNDVITCTIMSNSTCVLSNTAISNPITVTIDTIPVLAITTTAPPICINQTVAYGVTGAANYAWSNGSTVSGTSESYSVSGNPNINVTGTDGNGCSATASATVTVNQVVVPALSIQQTPQNGSVCGNGNTTVTLTATSTNGGTPQYVWNGCGTPGNGTYSISNITSDCAVSVVLHSNAVCASPDTAVTVVNVQVTTPVVPSVSIVASEFNWYTQRIANGQSQ